MVTIADKEFEEINELYNNGECIRSLKKQCNLINKEHCSNEILLDYRKKLYSVFINGDNGIDDEVIVMFKCAIEKCTFNAEKYNIPFIKKAIFFLEQKNNVDYNEINNWLDYFNISMLSDTAYGNNKYSDKEMYYLKKAKALDVIGKIEELKKLFLLYNEEEKQNDDIIFFIKYHICRLFFLKNMFSEANVYLSELLLIKREKYVMGLPIKFKDYTNQTQTAIFVVEILLNHHVEDYFFAYIINWLKNSKYSSIIDLIKDYFLFEDNKYKITNCKEMKKVIISNLLCNQDISSFIKNGTIASITKSGNAFVTAGNSNIFVDKKYVDRNDKVGNDVKYYVIEMFNTQSEKITKQAILINWRYLK